MAEGPKEQIKTQWRRRCAEAYRSARARSRIEFQPGTSFSRGNCSARAATTATQLSAVTALERLRVKTLNR
eukprot:808640-Amphidinium_carterae.1